MIRPYDKATHHIHDRFHALRSSSHCRRAAPGQESRQLDESEGERVLCFLPGSPGVFKVSSRNSAACRSIFKQKEENKFSNFCIQYTRSILFFPIKFEKREL